MVPVDQFLFFLWNYETGCLMQTITPDCADVTVASANLRQDCEATHTNAALFCPQTA
jgi:hypothetical protein